jgi:hypothetical protein
MHDKYTYRDGTTHAIFEPLDFVARLVALVQKKPGSSDPQSRRLRAQRRAPPQDRLPIRPQLPAGR